MAVRRIVLFGSYARGTQTDTSDIDVAVVVGSIPGDILDTEVALFKLRRDFDVRIEPVLLEEGDDRSGFLAEVLKTGEVIYDGG